jgi:hypothetical protein
VNPLRSCRVVRHTCTYRSHAQPAGRRSKLSGSRAAISGRLRAVSEARPASPLDKCAYHLLLRLEA